MVYKLDAMNTNSDALSCIAAIDTVTPSQNHVTSDYNAYYQDHRLRPVLNFDVIERDLFEVV